MLRIKKLVVLLITLFMVTALFAACGEKAPESSPKGDVGAKKDTVNLTWVNWGSSEEATKPAFDAMVKGFEEKYTHIKVEQVSYPFNQMKDQLLIMATGGNAPDVAQVSTIWVAALNEASVLEELEGVLDAKHIEDYYPGLLNGSKYNGKIMSAPWAPSPILVYYNKTLMQKAGIAAPPKTWEEMIQQAKSIAALGNDESGNKIYGLGISSKKMFGAGYFFLPFMWQNGGEFVDDQGKVVLNTPENVKAFTQTQMLFKEEITPAGLEIKELRNLFAQGQMGFHFDGEFGIGIFEAGSPKGKDFANEYGIMQCPGINDSNGASFAVEHHLVMFNKSKNKSESALLIDYLSGPEGMKIYNDNNGNKLPSRKTVEANDFYKSADAAALKPFIDALPITRSLPVQNVEFLKACEEIADAVGRVGFNNEEPAKVLENLQKTIKDLYKQ